MNSVSCDGWDEEQHSAEMATGYFTWMSWAIYFSFHWKDHVVVSGCFTEGLKALRSPGVFLSSSHVRIRLMALAVPLAWRSTRMDLPCEHPSSFYMVLAVPAMRMSLWLVVSCSISRSWTGLESKFLKLSLWHLRFMAEPHLLAELRIEHQWKHWTKSHPAKPHLQCGPGNICVNTKGPHHPHSDSTFGICRVWFKAPGR